MDLTPLENLSAFHFLVLECNFEAGISVVDVVVVVAVLLALMVAAADFLVVSPWLAPLSPQLLAQPYQT